MIFIRLYKINDVFHELKANNTAKQFLLLLKICDIQSGGSQEPQEYVALTGANFITKCFGIYYGYL